MALSSSSCAAAAWHSAALVALLLGLSACAVGPDYVRPALDSPPAWKEAGPWKTAQPQPADSAQPWWEAYGDATLNRLVQEANAANQNIQQAQAQYRQAEAAVAAARAAYWPGLGVNASAGRARSNTGGDLVLGNNRSVGLSADWQPDLWGSVRRTVEASDAARQASGDQLAGARLSIQGTVAQDYFQLRYTDLLRDLYAATVVAYTRAAELTQHQYAAGVALRSDVALAQSQLKTAQAQGVDLDATRAQLEHALAILTGRPPAEFSLPPQPAFSARVPDTPPGLPSELLERRPDIAAAERQVAQANAQIGVARAAYFPQLTLSASAGFSAARFATLFNTPAQVWSLGAVLAQTLLDGGLRSAHTDAAIAAYDASVAQYKQTVLGAFQQVEDNLATLRVLDGEGQMQDDAVQAAQLAERSALAQYRGGTATYLAVVTAQTLSLNNQRSAVQLRGRQMAASVSLVTAAGGGFDALTDVPVARAAAGSPSLSETAP